MATFPVACLSRRSRLLLNGLSLVLVCLLLLPGLGPARAAPRAVGDENWSALIAGGGLTGPGVDVHAALTVGNELYLGGSFTAFGSIPASGIARYDTTTGAIGSLGGGVGGSVRALVVVGDDLYVGGSFLSAGGVPANSIARYSRGSGTWSALGTGASNGVAGGSNPVVSALAVVGGDLYVGGRFLNAGGNTVSANSVARYTPATNTWSALGAGAPGVSTTNALAVYALTVLDGEVYAAGDFTAAGGAPANNLARYTPATNSWSPIVVGGVNGLPRIVYALAVLGGDLYVGGAFDSGAPAGGNGIVRYAPGANAWSALGSGATNGVAGLNRAVYGLAVRGADLYAIGQFNAAGGQPANSVARYWPAANTWAALGSGIDGTPFGRAMAVGVNDLFVAGRFDSVGGGTAALNVVRWAVVNPWGAPPGSGTSGAVQALAILGTDLYVGGQFTEAGGLAASNLARYSLATGAWSALPGGGANGPVTALLPVGTDLIVGGNFTLAGGQIVNRLVRFRPADGTWFALGAPPNDGVDGPVAALAALGGAIYVGGAFSHAAGSTLVASNLARYADGANTWSAVVVSGSNGAPGPVTALLASGSDLYVGGAFATVAGISATNIARYSHAANTWATLGTGPVNGTDGPVLALAQLGSEIYLGGSFTNAGDRTGVGGLVAYGPGSNKFIAVDGGTNGSVRALSVVGNDLYLAGDFSQAGSAAATRVVRYSPGSATRWFTLGSAANNGLAGATPNANALTGFGTFVVAGGLFETAGGVTVRNLAVYSTFVAPPTGLAALKLYWNGASRSDNLTAATETAQIDANATGYGFVRVEGFAPAAAQTGAVPLKLFYSFSRRDNFLTATAQGEADALGAGYTFIRTEAYVFADQRPGTTPLNSYYSFSRGDNIAVATPAGFSDVASAGYTFVRTEGYIYPANGLTPLKSYWSPARTDNFTTATEIGQVQARGAGYGVVRTEGYVFSSAQFATTPLQSFYSATREDNFTTGTVSGVASATAAGYGAVRTEGYAWSTPRPGSVALLQFWSAPRADNYLTATISGLTAAATAGYTVIRTEGWGYAGE